MYHHFHLGMCDDNRVDGGAGGRGVGWKAFAGRNKNNQTKEQNKMIIPTDVDELEDTEISDEEVQDCDEVECDECTDADCECLCHEDDGDDSESDSEDDLESDLDDLDEDLEEFDDESESDEED